MHPTRVAPGPFLRWVGGKQQLVKKLLSHLPSDHYKRRYIEPFLGAGSLFFSLLPRHARLSDANPHLIQTYEALRQCPLCVRKELLRHIDAHSPEHYYDVRDRYNQCTCTSASQAARFIYLNKTCFNGIFRVNTKGRFNVPVGSKKNIEVPSLDFLKTVASTLSKAQLEACDYSTALSKAKSGDFVYLDPPYPALNGTSYFSHYTKDRFDSSDQKALASKVCELHSRGAKFMMSNADVPYIRELYSDYRIYSIPVQRYVSCKGTRVSVGELIIKNY